MVEVEKHFKKNPPQSRQKRVPKGVIQGKIGPRNHTTLQIMLHLFDMHGRITPNEKKENEDNTENQYNPFSPIDIIFD